MTRPIKDQYDSILENGFPRVSKDALLYEPYPDGNVRCHLCAHHCLIPEGKRGVCQVRQNVGGKLYTQGTLVAGVGMSVRNNRRQLE